MSRCGRGGEARRCIPGENERPALARGESVCKGVGNNQHRAVPAVEHEKTSHAPQGTEVSELGTSREDFPGGSVARNQPANAEGGLNPGSRRPREEGLAAHSSFLPGGPTDRGSRRAAVPGVARVGLAWRASTCAPTCERGFVKVTAILLFSQDFRNQRRIRLIRTVQE